MASRVDEQSTAPPVVEDDRAVAQRRLLTLLCEELSDALPSVSAERVVVVAERIQRRLLAELRVELPPIG